MQQFLDGLSAAWTFLFNCMTMIFGLHTAVPVFAAILALWVLDRIFGIFKLIKG